VGAQRPCPSDRQHHHAAQEVSPCHYLFRFQPIG
jgi:hypothetical protein